jgi:dephospho-CoA kinase
MKRSAPKNKLSRLEPSQRLYGLSFPLIGLTGGIATGKSEAIKILRQIGVPCLCADAIIRELYGTREVRDFIEGEFPEVINSGAIDFSRLRETVFRAPDSLAELENFLYPRMEPVFKKHLAKLGDVDFVVYDVPLLFEKNLHDRFDLTILIYAPRDLQKKRLLARDNISKSIAGAMLKGQMDIEKKRELADFVIENSGVLQEMRDRLTDLFASLK